MLLRQTHGQITIIEFFFTIMIQLDHCLGKYQDCKPEEVSNWSKKNIYVLCDARNIVDVVQKLFVERVITTG